jgi:hypothetical protein
VIDQDCIAGIQAAVGLPVHGELVAADPDIGVFAGRVAPDGRAGFICEPLRRGHLGAVTIGDHDRVAAHLRFDAAQEQIVLTAARYHQKADCRCDTETRHARTINDFVMQSQDEISLLLHRICHADGQFPPERSIQQIDAVDRLFLIREHARDLEAGTLSMGAVAPQLMLSAQR